MPPIFQTFSLFLLKCEKCQRIVKNGKMVNKQGQNCIIPVLYKIVNKLSKNGKIVNNYTVFYKKKSQIVKKIMQNCQQKGAKLYNCILYKMAMTGMSQFPGREADYRFAALLSL